MPPCEDHLNLRVPLQGCHNFRIVGGWRARDGRVLGRGRLFRSDALDQLHATDQAAIAALGIVRIFDLRGSAEIARAPSLWPEGPAPRLWTGAECAAEAEISVLMTREGADAQTFRAAMRNVYSRFPEELADAVAGLGEALLGGDDGAALVHCTAGKDRTGFATAMLLRAIDITDEDVLADYLLSNAGYAAARVRFNGHGGLDAIEARAPGGVAALLGVHPEYLAAAENRIATDFGGIDAWLEHHAGLDRDRRARLADRLLI